ncbi:MAG: ABC transporter ATP-binding protein [Sulfurimonas sp.]|nr:MAG: ABC transporter ATP-binding protein [Sulfurimonas sp.]
MKIKRLKIEYQNQTLVDIAFTIAHSLALVGQSGSGKSLTLKALLKMLPEQMRVDLEIQSDFELHNGTSVAYVPQNPFTALSPLTTVKEQFFVSDARMRALMQRVDLSAGLLHRYPPELSGGQLQRVVLAMALSFEPKLLMLDEPTTALDPQTRLLIMALLKKLQAEMGFKMLFVTHDMNAAETLCNEICIIKSGNIVETGLMKDIIAAPQSAYTKLLIEANFSHRNFRE